MSSIVASLADELR